MMSIAGNPNKAINDFSKQFQGDFTRQLRTAHGTKPILINRFYNEFINDKEHLHMNATRWPSLTEFAKHLGREGICRIEETDKGLQISWIDNSPEALKRQDAIRKRERMEKGDEEREQKLIQEQVERAQEQARVEKELDDEARALQRTDGEKIKLDFGLKSNATKAPSPPTTLLEETSAPAAGSASVDAAQQIPTPPPEEETWKAPAPNATAIKMSLGAPATKPKNVFSAKKNPLAAKKSTFVEQPKKMSEAERIMKEEMERKRPRDYPGGVGFNFKKQRVD